MCAVKFLKLEDFLDDERHGLAIDLEPKGLLFAEVLVAVEWQLIAGLCLFLFYYKIIHKIQHTRNIEIEY